MRKRQGAGLHQAPTVERVHVAFEGLDGRTGYALEHQSGADGAQIFTVEVHDVHALVAGQWNVEVVGAPLLGCRAVPEIDVDVAQYLEVVLFEDRGSIAGTERFRSLAGGEADPW